MVRGQGPAGLSAGTQAWSDAEIGETPAGTGTMLRGEPRTSCSVML